MSRRARVPSCLLILAVLGISDRANVIAADSRHAVPQRSNREISLATAALTSGAGEGGILAWRWAPFYASDRPRAASIFTNHPAPRSGTAYPLYFVAVALAGLSQLLSIVGLLVQRARRRRAEEALRVRDRALRRSSERIEQLAGQLISAEESVRTHIARDLHDDVAQRLSLLAIDLSMLHLQFGQMPSTAHQQIREMSSRAAEIGSDLHRLSHELHPALLEELGLEAAMRNFCRELSNARHLDIDLRVHDLPHPVTPDVALCVYRVAQEALHNVARHSGVSSAFVSIECTGNDLLLNVTDHGAGFDVLEAHERDSLGLRSIEERVSLLDGDLSVWSKKGEGTHIEARVPLQPQPSASMPARSSAQVA